MNKSHLKNLPLIARVALGLIFFVFGLNGFLNFLPAPAMPANAIAFVSGLASSGYFFPLLKGVQVFCGLLLIVGAFVPLALVILAPIILNIFLFHVFLAPAGIILASVMGLLEVYLAFFSAPYSGIVTQIFRCPMREAMKSKK